MVEIGDTVAYNIQRKDPCVTINCPVCSVLPGIVEAKEDDWFKVGAFWFVENELIVYPIVEYEEGAW